MKKEIKCPFCRSTTFSHDGTLHPNGIYLWKTLVRCNDCNSPYWIKERNRTQKALMLPNGKFGLG